MSTRPEPHDRWKASKPHKGDAIYNLASTRIGTVSHVDDSICWMEGGNCFIWCFHDGLNNQHTWSRKAREVTKNDLVLYAINTGEFYKTHVRLSAERLDAWFNHVRDRVLPRYSREIEPVWAPTRILEAVATELKDYYVRHVFESKP